MVKIILHGCSGAMGRVVTDFVSEYPDAVITAGIDPDGSRQSTYPVYGTCDECTEDADVIIDFSVAAAVDNIVRYALKRELPLVLCTTGLSEAQIAEVNAASEKIPVLRSANMSLGINTMLKLASIGAAVLGDAGFDTEIIEKHHNKKTDAPSGTAFAIADAVNEASGGRYTYKLDRSSERAKRDPDEIGIQSLRGGSIVGEHELYFCGPDEVLEIKHTAYSKTVFAKGAVEAAEYLSGKPAGLYSMKDVIGQ